MRLKSSDGKIFEVPKAVALLSVIIKTVVEDLRSENPIPLPSVSSDILEKIIKYCTYHVDHPIRTIGKVDPWDAEFVNVDLPTLFQIGWAAQSLDIATLLDLVCRTIAGEITACKTHEKVREMLNIENDLTPEDVEAIKRQAPWAFDNETL